MSSFEHFLENQSHVYSLILEEQDSLTANGARPDPAIAQKSGGFVVMLRYPQEFIDKLEIVTKSLPSWCPIIALAPKNIHTTIVTYGVRSGHASPVGNPEESEVVDRLIAGVQKALHDTKQTVKGIEIDFHEPLVGATTIIVPGLPNKDFFRTFVAVVSGCKASGLEVREPWGAHCTLARFKTEIKPQKMTELLEKINFKHLGKVKPVAIDVAFMGMPNGKSIKKIVYKSFPL
ncbi:MAG: hypothetical protein HGA61_04615 [Candidatus Moranbacteria bacterium]|nr:hypothetical protein [Candidatus Moranbacteria bacterium]